MDEVSQKGTNFQEDINNKRHGDIMCNLTMSIIPILPMLKVEIL